MTLMQIVMLLMPGYLWCHVEASLAAGNGTICFQRGDFQHMFSARTARPDKQLASYMLQHPAEQHYPTYQEIHQALFHTETSIYAGFQPLPSMWYGGGVTQDTIAFLRSQLQRPVKFMVEVGSFLGNSATMFGKHLLEPHEGLLLCIDTWDGDINMWLLPSFVNKMGRHHGAPALYERFLSRMVTEKLHRTVIPLRASSTVGARILAVLNYQVDMIYLDSAHEAGETYFELNLFWDLLPAGGVLCGDDYYGFPAVKHDVDLFMQHHTLPADRLAFTPDTRTWAIVKEHGLL